MVDVDDGTAAADTAGGARAAVTRRRRANVPGGRSAVRTEVRLSEDEAAVLSERARDRGVSLPRLLVESALTEGGPTPTDRRDDLAKLFALQRTLGGIGNNLNQLAKHANTNGGFPQQAFDLGVRIHELFDRLDRVLDDLSTPKPSPAASHGAAGDVDVEKWPDVDRSALAGTEWGD